MGTPSTATSSPNGSGEPTFGWTTGCFKEVVRDLLALLALCCPSPVRSTTSASCLFPDKVEDMLMVLQWRARMILTQRRDFAAGKFAVTWTQLDLEGGVFDSVIKLGGD